ncbi:MAG: hypothetical protein JWM05_1732 [Acidimicrobiales bacterium]|nr:hypothetical protein [Acidimicrobiales bacterium]
MKITRTLAPALLFGSLMATTLSATPVHPASAEVTHKVIVRVTSIKVLDSTDPTACGEFRKLAFTPDGVADSTNIVPDATVNPDGYSTYIMCAVSTKNVNTYDVPGLVAAKKKYNGYGLFQYEPLSVANTNARKIYKTPGQKLTLRTSGHEVDPGSTTIDDVGGLQVEVPPPGGKNTYFYTPRFENYWGKSVYPLQYRFEVETLY